MPPPHRRGLVDSFFPILSDFDDRIAELEEQVFGKASDKQRRRSSP
jgi:Mg2+ and Co2+ transporter CorA